MLSFRLVRLPALFRDSPNSLGSHSSWQLEKQVLRHLSLRRVLFPPESSTIWSLPSFNLVLHAGLRPLRKIQKLMLERKKGCTALLTSHMGTE